MAYYGFTPAHHEANERWRKKQDPFQTRLQPGQRDRINEACGKTGESINQYIVEAINQRLEKEGF